MELTKRLRMVADCVTPGSKIADVGCDHAYISIDLTERGTALCSIAMDINQGPLIRAEENIRKHGLSDKIQVRRSDGLESLTPGEADGIILAGMGGALMVKILMQGAECMAQASEVILQPQSEIGKVRQYLHSTGFGIIFENMCIDAGKYYTVIKAKRNPDLKKSTKEVKQVIAGKLTQPEIFQEDSVKDCIFEEYGEYLLRTKHPILREYLEYKKKGIERLLQELSEHSTQKAVFRLEESKRELAGIEEALTWFEKGEIR